MSINLATLATEINTDPLSLGYAALKTAHNRVGLANRINDSATSSSVVYRSDCPASDLLACLVYSEVKTLTGTDATLLLAFLSTGTIDGTKQSTRDFLAGLFGGIATPTTLTALAFAIRSPIQSRAEELFGYSTRVTEQNVADAGIN